MLNNRIPYTAIVDRPKLLLPNKKKMAVWVILNVEHWSIDKPMPRTVLPPPMGKPLIPDVPNWSWHEYGMRSGFWRQYQALVERKIPTTLAINGNVCVSYPRIASAALEAGWEFMGHGFLQGPMHNLADQEKEICKALDTIEQFCGRRPTSWESPGLTETTETVDLLRKHGVKYVADWIIDDLPEIIDTPYGTMTTIPYTVETNDITVYALQAHRSPEFFDRGKDQFDRLYAEAENNVRVMAISIHPYITGVPHRIKYLEALLDYIGSHEEVEWMTASQIGDWYGNELQRLSGK